jgi:uroporphyrinogen-III decarboxylase
MMTSRERMLAALNSREPDHAPCSFMLFNGLKTECRDYFEFIERQIEMGLDAYVELPPRPPVVVNDHYNLHGLPVNHDPRVEIKEWIEHPEGERLPVMVKEYLTPEGTLRAEVYQTSDWRWGDHVTFLDDYIIPRSRKFLLTEPEELAAFRYLLAPPEESEVESFFEEAEPVKELANRHDLLVAGGWGVAADLIGWVYGLENMVFAPFDRPEFLRDLLGIIAAWNRSRMEVVLDAGIDVYIKRAWYENCDFWTPAAYREFLYPILEEDVALAHEKGAAFGYIITSNCMPLLDMFAEVGIDVIMGIDPAQWDMAVAKEKLGGKVALWGGVNGHVTVEHGSSGEVRDAVRDAMEALAPGGGFVLSPVDNVRENTSKAFENSRVLIDEWRRLTNQ